MPRQVTRRLQNRGELAAQWRVSLARQVVAPTVQAKLHSETCAEVVVCFALQKLGVAGTVVLT
jgi:hypothetical protein